MTPVECIMSVSFQWVRRNQNLRTLRQWYKTIGPWLTWMRRTRLLPRATLTFLSCLTTSRVHRRKHSNRVLTVNHTLFGRVIVPLPQPGSSRLSSNKEQRSSTISLHARVPKKVEISQRELSDSQKTLKANLTAVSKCENYFEDVYQKQ